MTKVSFRLAEPTDLPALVRMLADDPLGAQRERFTDPLPTAYHAAFDAIDADRNNELVVAIADDSQIVGVLQLTYIPSLTYQGTWRAMIEGVRVDAAARCGGVGTAMMQWAIDRARARGCGLMQLTTDKSRTDAQRFYEKLGFLRSHDGMKLHL